MWPLVLVALVLVGLLYPSSISDAISDRALAWVESGGYSTMVPASCPQQNPWELKEDPLNLDLDVLAERLSRAVQVDTSVGDQWPDPDKNPEQWKAFDQFEEYLRNTFPRVHEKLALEKVHQHGLFYTWKGQDDTLKPILLMSHQDVVPVNPDTYDQWMHPPFSGFIDRENGTVWGRGSTDCKAWVVGIMSAIEGLVELGFEPTRTVLVSLGFDEESNGIQGAGYLSKRIEEVYGKDSIAMILDEGNPVLAATDPLGPGMILAMPGVEEKGAIDVEVTVETSGGHSSMPPPHTSIGLVSRAVAKLEDARDQMAVHHLVEGAQLTFYQCIRDAPRIPPRLHAALKDLEWAQRSSLPSLPGMSTVASLLPNNLLSVLRRPDGRSRERRIRTAKQRVIEAMPEPFKVQFVTTTAADIISGGVKLNALPESATAKFNHRISTSSNVAALKAHYVEVLEPLAKKYGLGFEAWGNNFTDKAQAKIVGHMTVKQIRGTLEPAPKMKLSGDGADVWRLFSSVVRTTWKDTDGTPIVVAPSIMQGNTDTRYYHVRRHGCLRLTDYAEIEY